jgi:eukaryotic-like serine/threonine-protein kinase
MITLTRTMTPVMELDQLTRDFEKAWRRQAPVPIDDFLPARDHPRFENILCELVCIDLEMRWTHGFRKRLNEYRPDYPELFTNSVTLRQLAYEEYRQRLQADEPVDSSEYGSAYGVDTRSWPRVCTNANAPATCVVEESQIRDGITATQRCPRPELEELLSLDPDVARRLQRGDANMPAVGDRIFGFELVQVLGKGSFATVFLAKQSLLAGRLVALKVAPALQDEPRKLARLQHTNIVPIYSAHRSETFQAVCMPYFGATTLAQVIKSMSNSGRIPATGLGLLSTLYVQRSTVRNSRVGSAPAEPATPASAHETDLAAPILEELANLKHVDAVLWIIARLASGLQHAHQRGILHLDIKPANVLITDDGQPMLLDFNLAMDSARQGAGELARIGGTLPYMPLEQLEIFAGGPRNIDARADLFSLGVVFFELLTGQPAYPNRLGLLKSVLPEMIKDRKREAPSPRAINPAVSPAVDAIVRKLLSADPARRYQSAADLQDDLERQLSNRPLRHAPDRSLAERFRKWRRRHPRLATACLVGLAALVLLVLPITVIAVRENQIAERRMQVETAEAKQTWQELGTEARTVQVLLATQTGNRELLERGLQRGNAVLQRYAIGVNPDWAKRPLFDRLPDEQKQQARAELGEMLLLMVRANQIRARDAVDADVRAQSLRQALEWSRLAEDCYPVGARPRLLARQRAQLLEALPGESSRFTVAPAENGSSEFDAYHDSVAAAMDGSYGDALALLLPFTQDHPGHFQAWFVRGLCHDMLGQYAKADAAYSVCTALEPDMRWTWFNRAVVRIRLRDFRGADADLTKALAHQPGWTDARLNRALARKGAKEFASALEDLDTLLEDGNAPVRAWFLRADVRQLAGDKKGAAADRAEGFKREPTDELSWSTRGYARMDDQPAEALKDFDRALAINPRSRDALLNKSIVLSESFKKMREAVEVLDQLLEYYPDHVGAIGGRGVLLARLGESDKARRDAKECLRRERTPFLLFQMAGLYAQLAKHEKALDAKQEALALLDTALRNGFSDIHLLRTDADLEPIRNEADYRRLVEAAAKLHEPRKANVE